MLYKLVILNLLLTCWPRGARLMLQDTSNKHLCQGHIFNSIPTLGTSPSIPSGSCDQDRVDSLLLFLHLCNSAHCTLFCRNRLRLLTALHPLTLHQMHLWCKADTILVFHDFFWKKTSQHVKMGEEEKTVMGFNRFPRLDAWEKGWYIMKPIFLQCRHNQCPA